jgi:hypothetical protein
MNPVHYSRLMFIILLLPAFALAEEESTPGNFYKDNYAVSPLDKNVRPQNIVGNKQGSSGSSTSTVRGTGVNSTVNQPYVAQGLDGLEAQPVLSVGVILNAFDMDHSDEYLAQLADFLTTRRMAAGNLYLRHMRKGFKNEATLVKLMLLGGSNLMTSDLPEKYTAVERSPTWIVRTEKGEYLLEGVEKLERFITKNGGFVEKPIAAPALEVTPTPIPLEPESF